jgi:AraC family transcriptional regulator
MSDPVVAESGARNHPGLHWTRLPFDLKADHPTDRDVEVSPPDAVSRRGAILPGVAVEIVQANRRCRIDYRYCASAPLLVFHDRGARHDGCTEIQGLPTSRLRDFTRKFVFVPGGHEYHDWHEPRTLSRVIFFYFDSCRLAAGTQLGLSPPSPRIFFEDGALTETASKLANSIQRGSYNPGYLEALGVVLAHELAQIDAATRGPKAFINGGLAAWQRRKTLSFIEEHLAEPISLEVLAGLAGLSTCYFCRAFRRSCGMPPQRYQLSQRIERAKALLTKNTVSVTDIGLAVGYNDVSAFCTAFRRVAGVTPSAYRRSLGERAPCQRPCCDCPHPRVSH